MYKSEDSIHFNTTMSCSSNSYSRNIFCGPAPFSSYIMYHSYEKESNINFNKEYYYEWISKRNALSTNRLSNHPNFGGILPLMVAFPASRCVLQRDNVNPAH